MPGTGKTKLPLISTQGQGGETDSVIENTEGRATAPAGGNWGM